MVNGMAMAGSAWLMATAGPGYSAADPEAAARLFAHDRLVEVRLEIDPADWDKLRKEHHDILAALGPDRFQKAVPKPYKVYKANVSIDGVEVNSVGLKKRGFLGSSNFRRPSLGIRFDEYDPKARFAGLSRMSLNNNLQDPSQAHQALAYAVFAKAGVPAPRCGFARVTVNGEYLGVYSHVEAVEDEFLERHFRDATGQLYEGQLVDFRPDWIKGFERKNHKKSTDWSALEAVAEALKASDEALIARLEAHVDLDAYLTYWAVESLIGHWDSYSNNGNNFFVYRSPASGKFHFIPWGADSVFGDPDPFTQVQVPESVQARSLLPYRLYRLPETRELYRQRLRQLIESVWNENELNAEVDRIEELLAPHVRVTRRQFQNGLDKIRIFVRTRRPALEKELAGVAPEWPLEPKKSASLKKVGTFSSEFATTWMGKANAGERIRPSATVTMEIDGQEVNFPSARVNAGPGRDARNAGSPVITIIGFQWLAARAQIPVFVVEPELFRSKSTLPVDAYGVCGILIEGQMLEFNAKSLNLLFGTLDLIEAGTEAGDVIRGKVQATIYRLPR